ncbi:MAG: L,D-transpeptidase family protein [Aquificaceae bacterium]|nr:L,D-transpeptidase family protein [Aquificaceae bacterium]
MAVTLPILILILSLEITQALEKSIRANSKKLTYPQKVYRLYKNISFRCIWFCDGLPTYNLQTFEKILQEAVHHGLNPRDYEPPEDLDLELSYTDRLIKLSYDLYYGKVNPSKIYGNWSLQSKPDTVVETLSRLLLENRLEDLFLELAPKSKDYWFLVEKSKFLKDLSYLEWKPIRINRELKLGDRSPCLTEIGYRLFLLGDLEEYTGSDLFDEKLQRAMKHFQKRHGLPETGSIDQRTLRELNMRPEERLRQVYINLEKHRWVNIDSRRAVLVNIPSFELFYIEGGRVVLTSKVIVGRNYKEDFRPTPMLQSKINSITINPKWYVPLSISVKDILPKVKKDPTYLKRKGFKVFYMGEEIDPMHINWNLYKEDYFPFKLVQEAGPKNALGRIKFNFPNPFAVYLHDTPDKHLFRQAKRAFSSGCIRVERAKDLALKLLGEDWSIERLESTIKKGETRNIALKESVPIYLLYFTAFEEDGKLQFREDLYGYDTILLQAILKAGGGI